MATKPILQTWFPSTRSPLLCNAPMFMTANSTMAAAVSKAGGLGFIGGGFDLSQDSTQIHNLNSELVNVRSILAIPQDETLPVGIGLLTFHPSFGQILETIPPVLERQRVAAVWLAFSESGAHGNVIKELKAKGAAWGLKVFVQVGTVEIAREAARQGADVIVAQGVDAGGHQWARGAGIITLVPEVRDMLDSEFAGREIALVAAGGIVDGRGLAAAETLGAEGIVMGTKFVATKESPTPTAMKEKLLSTNDGGVSTIKSTVHDDLQGTGVWPPLYDGRAIIGDPYTEHKAGASTRDLLEKFKAANAGQDHSRKIIWCGTGVGLIKNILSCEDVVNTTFNQYHAVKTKASGITITGPQDTL